MASKINTLLYLALLFMSQQHIHNGKENRTWKVALYYGANCEWLSNIFIVERPSWQLLHGSSFGDVRIVEPMQAHKIVNMGYKLPN
jgi:hypothetical protein